MVFGVPSCKYNIVWYTPKPYSNYKGPYIRGVGLGGFVLQGFGMEGPKWSSDDIKVQRTDDVEVHFGILNM